MNATDVIGYAFDSDIFCPVCTDWYIQDGILTVRKDAGEEDRDQHGIPFVVEDSYGQVISAIFADAEFESDFPPLCVQCCENLYEVFVPVEV